LPQNSVNAILQTRDGYLWLGTEEGLVRFDGIRFTVYSSRTVAAFRQNEVNALAQTADGDLWIGTIRGLIRRHGEQFTAFGKPDGLPDHHVSALATSPDGTLWIGTASGGLGVRSAAGRFSTAANRAQGLPDDSVTAVARARDGSVWIGTDRGLARLRDGKLTPYPRSIDAPDSNGITDIREAKDGSLWIGSTAGLLRFTGRAVLEDWAGRPGMPEGGVSTVLSDRDGSLWMGGSQGIVRMRDGNIERFTIAQGLPTNVIVSMLEDREGSLWIGTIGAGILRFREAPVRTFTRRDGMASDFVRPVLEAPDGSVWAGTRGGGLSIIRDGRVAGSLTTDQGLPSNSITALARSADGSILVGTSGGNVSRVSNDKPRAVSLPEGRPTSAVRVLLEDRAGVLWIGTAGEGLARFDHGVLTKLTAAAGLAGDDVAALLEGPDGALWVGTRTGLSRVRGEKVEVPGSAERLSGRSVLAFLADPDGTVWIGTTGEGLLRWRGGATSSVTARDGLFDDVVFSIVDDQRGNLWMSCNRGIFRVARTELDDFFSRRKPRVTSVSYAEADGMKSAECNGSFQPSAWQSRDGGLWFPTIQGIALIRPSAIRANGHAPPVILESVLVDNREVPLAAKIRLAPGSRSLELHFTGVSFLSPEKMLFRYQLAGFDPSWVDAGTRRAAYYTHLPPGDYVFRVIAANADGVWNRTGASVPVSIEPTFTQSPLFAIGVALAIAGTAFGVFRLRLRALKERARDLERAVTEATSNIRVLRGLFPICAACKKIRDDGGYWKQIEGYIRDHSEAEFSHSICPDCMERLYPEFTDAPDEDKAPEAEPS
jgi:ligand-binding sensor domain-containing protein